MPFTICQHPKQTCCFFLDYAYQNVEISILMFEMEGFLFFVFFEHTTLFSLIVIFHIIISLDDAIPESG